MKKDIIGDVTKWANKRGMLPEDIGVKKTEDGFKIYDKRSVEMKLDVEFMYKGSVEEQIACCEGKHVQQVAYSAYHRAVTQICFGCKKIRTSMAEEDLNK